AEGNGGTKTASFAVTLSKAQTQAVTVAYATSNATRPAGSDYVATQGTLTFAPGQTSKTIPVTINGDATVEPNETFVVTLSNPTNATLAKGTAQGQITNDDQASSTISASAGFSVTNDWGTGFGG